MSNVILLDEPLWSFEKDLPFYRVGGSQGAYTSQVTVDPFPGYHHDIGLVEDCLHSVENACPIFNSPDVYVLRHETDSRTNGWADIGYLYDDESKELKRWEARIVLSGKRIPPHPAMTRYLVAHEYGHHVQWALARVLDQEDHDFLDDYARLRNATTHMHYGGGTWHDYPGELFANDFRILVAGAESEFWPHPNFEHPSSCSKIVKYWEQAKEILSEDNSIHP
jgi:hypothetical protein